mmetsp:Transcript_4092/g.7832  ORF Transcript_4092/g.7832 Transcript_4092/m.7832 type:complete len:101 (+) Transcript_4092:1155-1457(+)
MGRCACAATLVDGSVHVDGAVHVSYGRTLRCMHAWRLEAACMCMAIILWLSLALLLRSSAYSSQTALRFAEGFCMCNAVASLRYVHAAHDYCNDVRSIFT